MSTVATPFLKRRRLWTNQTSGATADGRVRELTAIHHDAGYYATGTDPVQRLQGHRSYHVDTKGWDDIAYNLAVDGKGGAWELRGVKRRSGATRGMNVTSYALMLMGDFTKQNPSTVQLEATAKCIHWMWEEGYTSTKDLISHQDAYRKCSCGATACPGDNVISRLDSLENAEPVWVLGERLLHSGLRTRRGADWAEVRAVLGGDSESSIKDFQAAAKLSVDGFIGPVTAQAIRDLSDPKDVTPPKPVVPEPEPDPLDQMRARKVTDSTLGQLADVVLGTHERDAAK